MSFSSRALYRSRQVLLALRPRIEPEGLSFARTHLGEPAASLFFDMEKRDQRHALEVAGRLRAAGADNTDLLTAALLHDCGKGVVPVWLRIAFVLSPAIVRGLARKDAAGTRGAAYRLANHVARGAAKARQAGVSDAAVRLISGKPNPDEARLMTLLIQADDAS